MRERLEFPLNESDLRMKTLLITDFGMSCSAETDGSRRSALGTIAYAAPEVLCRTGFTRTSDVWSYGVVMWEIFTMIEASNNRENVHQFTDIAVNHKKLFIPTGENGFPSIIDELITSCWEIAPEKRPQFPAILRCLQDAGADPFFGMPTEDFLQIQNEWRLRILRKTEESDSCIISECSSNEADLLAADQLELTRIQLQMSQQSEFLLQQKLASLKLQMYKMSVDFANRIHASSNVPAPRPPPRRRPFADVLLRRQHNNHSHGETASSRAGGPTNSSQLSIATSLVAGGQAASPGTQKIPSRKDRGGGHTTKFLPPAGRSRTGLYFTGGSGGGGGGGRSASPASVPYISPPSNLEHCVHVPNEDIYCPTQPLPLGSLDPLGTANFTNTTSPLFRSRTPSETISPSCPCMLTMRSPTAWQNGQPFSVNDSTGLFPLSGYADDLLVTGQFDFLEAFARPDAAAAAAATTLTDRFETTSPLPSCKSVPNLFEKSATTGRQGISQERHTISKGSSVVPTERKSKSRRIGLSNLFHSSRKRSSSKRRKISALENKTGEEKVESPISPGVGVGINGSNTEDRRRSFTRHSSLGSLHLSTSVPTRSRKSSRPPKFFAKYLTPTRKKSTAATPGNGGGGSSNNNHKDSNTGVVDAPTSSRRKKKSSMNTDEESLLSCTSQTRSFDESGSPVVPSATGHSDYCTNQADSRHASSSTCAAASASSRSLPRPPWYSPGVVGLRQLLTFPPVQLLQPVVERCRNVFGSSDRISRPSSRVRYSVLSRGDNTMSRSLDAIFSASSEDRSQILPSVGGTNDGACSQPPIDAALWSAFRVVSIVPLLLGLSSSPTAASQDTKTSPPSSRPTLLEMATNAQQASASGSAANTPDSQSLRVLLRHAPKTTTNNSAAPAPENRLSSSRVKFSPYYGGAPGPDPSPPVEKGLADFLSPSEDQQKPLTAPTSRGRQLCRHWTPQRELSAPAEGTLTAGRRKLSQPAPNHLHYPCHPYYHHYHHHQPYHHHPQHQHHHHRLPLSIHCCYCCSASNDAQQYTVGGQHQRDSFHAVPSGHSGCCCSSCSMHNDSSYSPSSAAALLSPSGCFVGLRISGRHSSPCPPSTVAGGAACSQLAHSDILNGGRFTRLDSTSSSADADGIFSVAPSPLAGAGIVGPARLTPSSLDADAEHSHATDYSPCSQVLSADSPQNISWTLAASSRQSSTRSSFSRLSIDNPVAASRDAYLKVTQDGYLNRSAGDGSFDESEVSAPILHGTGVFSPLYSSELVSLHGYLSKGAGASTSIVAGGDSMHQEPNPHSFDDYRPPSGDFDALEASFGAGEAAEDTATLYAELQQSDDACANVNSGSYEPVFPQNPFNYYNLRVTTGDQEEPQCNDRAEPFEERKVSADITTTDESPSLAESETASTDPPPVVQPQSTPCRRRLAFRSVDRRPPIVLRNRIHTDTDDDALESVFQDEAPLSSQCASAASDADLSERNLRTETRTSF
ncbi:hypothetical protein SprV_0301079800 [Sparganum proliferum]